MELWIAIALLAGAHVFTVRLWLRNRELVRTFRAFAPIENAYAEVQRATAEAAQLRTAARTETDRLRADVRAESDSLRALTQAETGRLRDSANDEIKVAIQEGTSSLAALRLQREALSADYATAHALYERLRRELSLLEENAEDVSVGLYKPHYTFESSEAYRKALDMIWNHERVMVKGGIAARCAQSWEVQGDKRAGERMTKQYLKLILRAFNSECDAAIAKVTWSNITKMEERIRKSHEILNDLGSVMKMAVSV